MIFMQQFSTFILCFLLNFHVMLERLRILLKLLDVSIGMESQCNVYCLCNGRAVSNDVCDLLCVMKM